MAIDATIAHRRTSPLEIDFQSALEPEPDHTPCAEPETWLMLGDVVASIVARLAKEIEEKQ